MTWDEIRQQRNQLLKDSDWTQITDVQDVVDIESWRIYRQELRNITENFASPDDVVWPQEPSAL